MRHKGIQEECAEHVTVDVVGAHDEAPQALESEAGKRAMTRLLAPLKVGDQLPWRLDSNGVTQWLTVIEVVDGVTYVVRYPNGTIGALVDSE